MFKKKDFCPLLRTVVTSGRSSSDNEKVSKARGGKPSDSGKGKGGVWRWLS
ncbi:hypothetical protein V6Z11_A07G102900 [Gossypium hirsutum]